MKNTSSKASRGRFSSRRTKGLSSSEPVEASAKSLNRKSRKIGQREEVKYVAARSSINQLYDVICNFDDLKKELVRSIGFGGMLLFPPIRQVNRRFAVWLMCRVDPSSQTLVLDDGKKIKFSK